ncbi:MAG: transcriptional regulator, LacI family, partial [Anaerospora sp.]|nr:transcriptional regulator, LacI family [Anaerospora sp.]
YDHALLQAGLTIDPSLIIESPATRQGGIEAIEKLLLLPDRPTAIFCYNDTIAIGAMMKLKDAGINPGQDMAIVGFDDIPEADCTHELKALPLNLHQSFLNRSSLFAIPVVLRVNIRKDMACTKSFRTQVEAYVVLMHANQKVNCGSSTGHCSLSSLSVLSANTT